jgi:hypothetical protein
MFASSSAAICNANDHFSLFDVPVRLFKSEIKFYRACGPYLVFIEFLNTLPWY